MTADPRSRWAEQLSVPANATQEAALAAFLRALPGDDFLPAAERVAAVNALAEAAAPVGQDYGVVRLLSDELDEFATRYWTLDPETRLATWSELSRRGASEPRLRELEPGLDLRTDSLTDPDADELARLFRELFVLPPRDRAIRRNTWLLENAMDAVRWRAALAVLAGEAPEVPALDARFRATLDPDFDLAAFVAGTALSTATHSRDAIAESIAYVDARRQEYEEDNEAVYEAADRRRAKRILWGGALTAGLLVLGCCLSGISNRTKRSEYAYSPPVSASHDEGTFTPADVAMFRQYERDQAARKPATPPPGYSAWVRLGRPSTGDANSSQSGVFTITFDDKSISECDDYDQRKRGPRPGFYEYWVKLGKPRTPGKYPLPR
jgi:hypothetical protein